MLTQILEKFKHNYRAGGTILKVVHVVGPALILEKKWWGPTLCFTLFLPKSGGAQAPPAHTLPPGLQYGTCRQAVVVTTGLVFKEEHIILT